MWAEPGKLSGVMGARRWWVKRAVEPSLEWRQAAELAQTVEETLESMGAERLSCIERRVLRAIVEGAAAGEMRKARRLAEEAGITLVELERVCDSLLAQGFIGPGPSSRRPS